MGRSRRRGFALAVTVLLLATACTTPEEINAPATTIAAAGSPVTASPVTASPTTARPISASADPAELEPADDLLVTEVVGDGSTITRVTAGDGSEFVLRLPESFGTSLRLLGRGSRLPRIASVVGDGFGVHIEVGHCPFEPLTVNALGLLAAPVRPRPDPCHEQ